MVWAGKMQMSLQKAHQGK